MRRLLLSSLFAAGLAVLATSSLAATTTNLSGKVTDKASNEALPGVTVTVTSPQLIGGAKSAVSDQNGDYRFVALAPGAYTVTGTLSGFDTTTGDIRLLLGKDAVLNLSMGLTGVTSEIEVTAEAPVVEVSSTEVKTSIDDELVENIPILNRDFLALATLVPGVSRDPDNQGGLNVNGGRISDTNFQLDGLNISDASTGQRGATVNLDAIQELEVITNGYNAEYGRAQSGIINVVTKSGGNDYHGSASYYFRGETLDGVSNDIDFQRETRADRGDCDAAGKPNCEDLVLGQDFTRHELYLTGEGPIVKDKLWFFATGQLLQNEAVVNGLREEFDAGLTTDTEGISVFAKATTQLGENNTASILYNRDPRDLVNSQMGLRGATSYWTHFVTPDRETGGYLMSAKDTHVVSENMFVEALLGYQTNKVSAVPQTDSGFFGALLYPEDGIYVQVGGRYPFAFSLDRKRIQGKADATFYADWSGAHTFKAGFDLENLNEKQFNNYAPQLFGFDEGTYNFGNFQHTRFASDNPNATDLNGDGRIDNDPTTFELLGYAFVFDTSAANYDVKGTAISAFVQDEWQLSSGLTMNIGARLEREIEVEGAGGNVTVAPRFGLSWDPTGNGRIQVFGNTGLSYDKLILQNLTYAFSGAVSTLYAYNSPFFDPEPANWFRFEDFDENNPAAGSIGTGGSGVPDLALVDPDIKNPYTWYSSVGVKAELIKDLAGGITFLHREGKDLLQDIETNKRYNPASTTGLSSIDPAFDNITLLTNVNSSEYNAVQFELNKRFSNRWQLLANYTLSKAEGDGRDYTRLPSAGQNQDGDDPRLFAQEYSVLSYDRTHVLNISGNYNLPGDIQLGWSGSYLTGTPFSKLFTINQNSITDGLFDSSQLRNTTYIGGKNSFRLPNQTNLDLHIQKNLKISTAEIQVMADVFNVFDDDSATKVVQTVSYSDQNGDGVREFNDGDETDQARRFGFPTERRFGRQFQLGAKIRF